MTRAEARHARCFARRVSPREPSSSAPRVLVWAPLPGDDDTSPTEVFVRSASLAPLASVPSPGAQEASGRPEWAGHLVSVLTLVSLVLVGLASGHGAVMAWRHARGTGPAPAQNVAAVSTASTASTAAVSRTDNSVSPVEPVLRVEVRPTPAASVASVAVARSPSVPPAPNAPVTVLARPPRVAPPAAAPKRTPKVDAPLRPPHEESRSRAIATARSALDGAL